jgi:small-conductance mechanosensitive channel
MILKLLTLSAATPNSLDTDQFEAIAARFWSSAIHWVSGHSRDIIIALFLGLAIYLVLIWVRRIASRKVSSGTTYAPGAIFWRTLARTNGLFMAILPVQLIALIANPPQRLGNFIMLTFFAIATFQIAIWVREIILGLVYKRAGNDGNDSLYNALGIIRLLVTVALFAIAGIIVLDNLGVNVSALVAGLGIGGIAIGLAAQGIFADLFAALSILFDKPFRRGEVVQYDGTTATVEKIGLKSTRLRAISGEEKIISNTNLLGKEITNLTNSATRRVRLTFGIIYHTPADVLARIPVLAHNAITQSGLEFVRCGILALGPSAIDFELDFQVESDDLAEIGRARHAAALALLEHFRTAKVEFAYPTQTTYTAAPDGTLVMPYATAPIAAPPAATEIKPKATGTRKTR